MGIGVKMLSGDVILLKEATMEQFVERLNLAHKVQGEYIWVENSLINIRQIEFAADERTPTVKAEQKKGKWIYPSQDPEIMNKEFFSDCSVCGFSSMNEYKYCPNCGAKMEGEE